MSQYSQSAQSNELVINESHSGGCPFANDGEVHGYQDDAPLTRPVSKINNTDGHLLVSSSGCIHLGIMKYALLSLSDVVENENML